MSESVIGERPARNGADTAGTMRRRVAESLERSGRPIATPDLDARLIVGHVLGLDAAGLIRHADRPVDEADAARIRALAERRIGGEPVARIVGEKEFWSLSLRLAPETLVPRPDTETVVSAAVSWAERERGRAEPLTTLDLGTGSGAILLALLSELPQATGLGVDISEGAARMAAQNAARLGLSSRAGFIVSDWAAAIQGRFDVVVSNPPYIPTAEIAGLPVEVRDHDPDMALDGGRDGLVAHRAVIGALPGVLAAGGAAFIEVGAGQAEAVGHLGHMFGFRSVWHPDLSRIDRVVEFVRHGEEPKNRLGNRVRTG
jgi:release factor glutamine methyltransferase